MKRVPWHLLVLFFSNEMVPALYSERVHTRDMNSIRNASAVCERRRKTARHLRTGAEQSYFFLMQNLRARSRVKGLKVRSAGSAEGLERLTRLA